VDDLRRRNERERATMLDPLADQTPPAGIASSVLVAGSFGHLDSDLFAAVASSQEHFFRGPPAAEA